MADSGFNVVNANPTSYTVENGNIILKNPGKLGYAFRGWYSDKALRKRVTSIPAGSTGNIVLYAKWELVK